MAILRARARLGVVLHRKHRLADNPQSFIAVVEQRKMGGLDSARQTIGLNDKAMILAGDLDRAGQQILDRMIGSAMAARHFAGAPAERQGEQINRLTLVSLIFLTVTALSGFFGMNFNWMINHIESGKPFVALGVVLPVLSVMISIAWFRHRGLIQFNFGSRPARQGPTAFDEILWPTPPGGQTSKGAHAAETAPSATTQLKIRQTDEAAA